MNYLYNIFIIYMSSNQFVAAMKQKARKAKDYTQKEKNLIEEHQKRDLELERLKKDKKKLDDKLERRYWDKERANKETGIFSGIQKKSAKSAYDKAQKKSIEALSKVEERKEEISKGVQGDLEAYKNIAGKNWDKKKRQAMVVSRFSEAGRRTKKRRKRRKTKKKKRKRRKRNSKKRTRRRRMKRRR